MILVIGSNGQLGKEIQKAFLEKKIAYRAYDIPEIDITNYESINGLIEAIQPTSIINCAAYTNVDQAQTDQENAYSINAMGPKNLAQICNQKKIELVHISTDYVFNGEPICENGSPRPYLETDACDPKSVYGKTKLQGEEFVREFHDKWYIFRTAWLYGEGQNFVKTMLKLSEQNSSVRVVDDQIGSPTSTADLAAAICALLGTQQYGLYHATCEGQCSWYEFAREIFKIKSIDIEVVPVTSEEFIRPAPRPRWSVLENAKLKSIGENVFRHWNDALNAYLK